MGNICRTGDRSTYCVSQHPIKLTSSYQDIFNKQLTIKHSFKHSELNGVHEIQSYSTTHCWLRCFDENVLKLTNRFGDVLLKFEITQGIDGLSLYGDSIFLCFLDCSVRKVHIPSGKETYLFSTGPLCPLHISITPGSYILLTLCDDDTMSINSHSQRVVIRYDMEGNELNRAEKTTKGRNIFVVPRRISTNKSGSVIAVTNKTSELSAHLVLLNEQLELTLRYLGNYQVLYGDVAITNAEDKFCVNDVKFTSTGDILIAENWSKSVQLLTQTCIPLWTVLQYNISPTSVSIQNNSFIWIGNVNGSVLVLGTE